MEKTEFKQRSMLAETWKRLKKNKGAMIGLVIVTVLFLLAIFAGVIYDYDTEIAGLNIAEKLIRPCKEHIFGTDDMGRDYSSASSTARGIHWALDSLPP